MKPGDEIQVVGKDAQIKEIKETAKSLEDRGVPEWMEVSAGELAVKINRMPTKVDAGMPIEENLIVELYN